MYTEILFITTIVIPLIALLIYFYYKPMNINCIGCMKDGTFYKCKNKEEIKKMCLEMEKGSKLATTFKNKIQEINNSILKAKNEISKPINNIKNFINSYYNRLMSILQVGNLMSIIDEMRNDIYYHIDRLSCNISIKLEPPVSIPGINPLDLNVNPCDLIINNLKNGLDQFINTIKEGIEPLNQVFATITDTFVNIFKKILDPLLDIIDNLKNDFMEIPNNLGLLFGKFNNIISDVLELGFLYFIRSNIITYLSPLVFGSQLLLLLILFLPLILLGLIIIGGATSFMMIFVTFITGFFSLFF